MQKKQWLLELVCSVWGHIPRGPDNSISFEIAPGNWHPAYHCERCGHCLRWRVCGGWDIATKPAIDVMRNQCEVSQLENELHTKATE